MYSGILPRGLTADDLSPDEEEDEQGDGEERSRVAETCESSAGENTTSVVKAQPTQAASDAHSDSATCSMSGISQAMWQKFQDLRKKNEEMKAMKVPRKRKRKRHKKGTEEQSEEREERQEERKKHWDELKQYFGVNDRFHPPACSNPPQKSGLEKSMEGAIAEGDIAKAEEMSDRLATRELAENIARAADCRDFVRHKQEEEALRAMQKRKKQIPWGFEAKRRWETKSNMGFM